MIEKLTKVTYKQKKVKYENGYLVDENGKIIDLNNILASIYGDRQFDIVCSFSDKNEYELEEFAK